MFCRKFRKSYLRILLSWFHHFPFKINGMLEYVNIVFSFPHPSLMPSVGKNFRQNNYSAEDGIDEQWLQYLRRNFSCSAEQKILKILFRTIPRKKKIISIPYLWTEIEASFRMLFQSISRKRKQLGIPFRGTKIEANFWNFVLEHFAEEKTSYYELCGSEIGHLAAVYFTTKRGRRKFQKYFQKRRLLSYG